jgi:hypothetical protein
MKFNFSYFLLLNVVLLFLSQEQFAQNNQQHFDEFMQTPSTPYRTASGKPGPAYWQNQNDYEIAVSLDENTHRLTGKVTITYTNNSPEELDFIWLFLEQNRFTTNSRGTLTTPIHGNRYNGDVEGGYNLSQVKVNGEKAKFLITDTRMQVFLPEPLVANGGSTTISMNFAYKIPVKGMDRMGRLEVQQGTIYALAQWFPKVAVFDDVSGWNIEPYLGAGEFYLGYGNYDYKITVPYNHTVVASGRLMNPKEVLNKKVYRRYQKAQETEETTYLIEPSEVGSRRVLNKRKGTQTWHFKMENTRDIAFASSSAFIWDAANIKLASGKNVMAQSVYPAESHGQDAWSRSTEYTQESIKFYADTYYDYPYATAINVAADVGGMEYPGVSFCSYKSKGASLWGVTDHEFGHNWFPMIVGSNERLHAWMDEGFNTFINHYSTLNFNNGEYPADFTNGRVINPYLKFPGRESINTYPDATNLRNLAYTAYYKPAIGLIMLREYILGEERFDYAFKSYIKTWAFKHPRPQDFFAHMENASGESLNWFWKNWFYTNNNIDIAVVDVAQKEYGALISIENKGEIPMPVALKVTYADGTHENVHLPVEIWQRGNAWDYFHETSKNVTSVEFDPKKQVADIDGSNDSWGK